MWSVINAVCEFAGPAKVAVTFLVGAGCCWVVIMTFGLWLALFDDGRVSQGGDAFVATLFTLGAFYGVGYALVRWVF